MKCSTRPEAIERLVCVGMASTVSDYIAQLEADNKRLRKAANDVAKAYEEYVNDMVDRPQLVKLADLSAHVALLTVAAYSKEVQAWHAANERRDAK